MKVAICDDDASCHENVKKLLTEYRPADPSFSFLPSCFSSGKMLLDAIELNGAFDLYILDIIMPEMNGIQVGTRLREQNDEGMIIYLTSSRDFAVESYNTDALHYLLKPICKEQFFLCMDKAISRLKRFRSEVISVRTPGSTRIIPIRSILYAERVKRRIRYHLNDGTVTDSITFSGTFQRAAAPLTAFPDFLAVGASFVVNLRHVTEITKSDLVVNGQLVPIPRRIYDTVRSKWADYWLRKVDC